MHIFALHGSMQDGAAAYKFMVILSEKVLALEGTQQQLYYSVNRNLINIIWTLIYRD
jgi:hypothetical protein